MKLKDLKEYVNKLPSEFDEYEMVNGEVGLLNPEDEDSLVYRVDKPIIAMYVDETSQEVCMFHQTQEDVNKVFHKDYTNGTT